MQFPSLHYIFYTLKHLVMKTGNMCHNSTPFYILLIYSVAPQATQRSEEVRSFKMRLRFREDRIKRLEQLASGKLSAEAHLLQEKETLVKEIEALQSQLERNPEITRFAMENLQLKEDLRRLSLQIGRAHV